MAQIISGIRFQPNGKRQVRGAGIFIRMVLAQFGQHVDPAVISAVNEMTVYADTAYSDGNGAMVKQIAYAIAAVTTGQPTAYLLGDDVVGAIIGACETMQQAADKIQTVERTGRKYDLGKAG